MAVAAIVNFHVWSHLFLLICSSIASRLASVGRYSTSATHPVLDLLEHVWLSSRRHATRVRACMANCIPWTHEPSARAQRPPDGTPPAPLGALGRPGRRAVVGVTAGGRTKNPDDDLVGVGSHKHGLVEHIGFEPMASSMPWKRATNCANAPNVLYCNKKSLLSLEASFCLGCYAPTRGTTFVFKLFVLYARVPLLRTSLSMIMPS